MSKAEDIKKKIGAMMELPKEIMLNLPLISMIGNEEVMIENYKGIIEYTDERVRISTTAGIFRIEGKSLCLKQITSENIAVTGSIVKLEYIQ